MNQKEKAQFDLQRPKISKSQNVFFPQKSSSNLIQIKRVCLTKNQIEAHDDTFSISNRMQDLQAQSQHDNENTLNQDEIIYQHHTSLQEVENSICISPYLNNQQEQQNQDVNILFPSQNFKILDVHPQDQSAPQSPESYNSLELQNPPTSCLNIELKSKSLSNNLILNNSSFLNAQEETQMNSEIYVQESQKENFIQNQSTCQDIEDEVRINIVNNQGLSFTSQINRSRSLQDLIEVIAQFFNYEIQKIQLRCKDNQLVFKNRNNNSVTINQLGIQNDDFIYVTDDFIIEIEDSDNPSIQSQVNKEQKELNQTDQNQEENLKQQEDEKAQNEENQGRCLIQ